MNVLIYIIVLIVMNCFFFLFVVVRRSVRAILVVLKYNPSSNCLYDLAYYVPYYSGTTALSHA